MNNITDEKLLLNNFREILKIYSPPVFHKWFLDSFPAPGIQFIIKRN